MKQQIHSKGEQIEEKLRNYNQKNIKKIEIVDRKIKPTEEGIDFISKKFQLHKTDLKDIKKTKI